MGERSFAALAAQFHEQTHLFFDHRSKPIAIAGDGENEVPGTVLPQQTAQQRKLLGEIRFRDRFVGPYRFEEPQTRHDPSFGFDEQQKNAE